MKKYNPSEAISLVEKFNNKTLPKSQWNHEAHVIMAIWHNINYCFPDAFDKMSRKIIEYNESVGTLNTEDSGYHETLTNFWMILVKNFLLHHPGLKFVDAVNSFLLSKESDKQIVLNYYSSGMLYSKKARKEWVDGDIETIHINIEKLENHLELTDSALKSRIEDCSLPVGLFNHEAHLRLAWIDIKTYGIEGAVDVICDQITKYVAHLGAQDKFNKTLTIAATKAVNHFMDKSRSENFRDFIQEFPRLKTNFKDLISAHYGFDIFNSEEARVKYLEPDLIPF